MRYALLALALLAVGLTSCKKDGESDGNGHMLQAVNILEETETKFLEYGQAGVLSPQQALMETATWVQNQDGVADAYVFDSIVMVIEMESGLKVNFQYNPVDDQGYSLFRGGNGIEAVSLKQYMGSGSCSDAMSNDKVLLFAPFESEFYQTGELNTLSTTIGSTSKKLKVTILKNAQCTPASVKQFSNYGLVILDTHGLPEGFFTGGAITFNKNNKPSTEEDLVKLINTQAGSDAADNILSGAYVVDMIIKIKDAKVNWALSGVTETKLNIVVSSKFIKTIPKLNNTIVLGNMCYSGYNLTTYQSKTIDPIRQAFLSLDPISYFCYAKDDGSANAVSNIFATKMERNLVRRFVQNADSSKIAHLKDDNSTEYLDSIPPSYGIPLNNFKHFGKDTYCYTCGGNFTDARDGQVYKTVCIGNKVWMAENLRYDAPLSVCYDGNATNCTSYGRLYDWATVLAGQQGSYASPSGVRGVCPQGWHLPSENEYIAMKYIFRPDSVAGGALKSTTGWNAPNVGATNSSGFNAKAAGQLLGTLGYTYLGTDTYFWTATPSVNSSTSALALGLTTANASAIIYGKAKTEKLSCRCVQD